MDAIQTALNATLPAFFLIALGAYADKLFPELHLPTLTRLTVYFMIPALVFNAVANTSLTLSSASLLSLGYLLYLIALGAVSALGSVGLSGAQTRGVIVTSLFGNTGNMGLPITLFAYGEAGLERAVVVFMLSLVLMFVVGPTVLAGGGENLRTKLVDALKLPPIWATLAGLAFTIFAWELPTSAARGMSLLGDAAIPVMLLSLGLQMRRSWVWGVGASALRASGLRLVIGPLYRLRSGLAHRLARLGFERIDALRRHARRCDDVRRRGRGQRRLRRGSADGCGNDGWFTCGNYVGALPLAELDNSPYARPETAFRRLSSSKDA